MKRIIREDIINLDHTVLLCSRSLRLYDRRLVDHGERVALIASDILEALPSGQDIDRKALLLLSVFHDIGAYKTEEIDRMLEFECFNVHAHSVYGFLFLKYFSPLAPYSEALLYHHMGADEAQRRAFPLRDYSNLIHLADRVDVLISDGTAKEELLSHFDEKNFDAAHLSALQKALDTTTLYEDIRGTHFHERVVALLHACHITPDEAMAYLKMLVFTIDFRSPQTVGHSIATTMVSMYLAEACGLTDAQLDRVYFASLVHDLGKIAIPTEILEHPGRLTTEQMEIMKLHVRYTEELLTDLVAPDVMQMAARHHEKLDGSGYPHGLTGEALSVSERIVAIADIFSALTGKRSYKERYDREKTLGILDEMARTGKLDASLVSCASEGYDELMRRVEETVQPLMQTYHALHREFEQTMAALTADK